MRVFLQTLGCRLNEAEAEHWAAEFSRHGHVVCQSPDDADIVVLNSCAVTTEAAKKSRQLVRRAARKNPHARLVVSGCWASLEAEGAAAIDAIDLLVPNAEKAGLVGQVLQMAEPASPDPGTGPTAEPGQVRVPDPGNPGTALDASDPGLRGRHRAFVKVQDGCRHRCSYCVVTIARGNEVSRPIPELVAEVRALAASGVREVVLTGVHLGGYGADQGTALADLMHAILADSDIARLRLGSIEPWDLSEAFFRLFEQPRVMPHLHLPLQSGSDRILKRMARRTRREDFLRYVDRARAIDPGFNITTDVIAGFPGEDSEDWAQTLATVETARFGHVHAFGFSARTGTAAADFGDQVPVQTRRTRVAELIALAEKSRAAFVAEQLGTTTEVLWERAACGVSAAEGYARNYLRVSACAEGFAVNAIDRVRLLGISDDGLTLRAEPVVGRSPGHFASARVSAAAMASPTATGSAPEGLA